MSQFLSDEPTYGKWEIESAWQPMETAPKDESAILLRAPNAEHGMVIGFWGVDPEDWYESEASSHSLSGLYGPFTGWMPLPDVDS